MGFGSTIFSTSLDLSTFHSVYHVIRHHHFSSFEHCFDITEEIETMAHLNEPTNSFESIVRFRARCLTLLLLLLVGSCSAMVVPQQYQQSAQQLSSTINLPHVAYISNNSTEIFIIGTSHFSSNSAAEVRHLISTVKPDGVVLELDPERCLRLTKQSCGFDASGSLQDTREDVVYGADFLAAINTCQEMDIPLFLGDEYAEETRNRLIRRMGELNAYSPIPLIQSLVPKKTDSKITGIDIIETFKRDPKKLTPLVVTTSPPFALASVFSLFNSHYNTNIQKNAETMTAMLGSSIEIGLVIVASLLLSSLLFNNVIVERDRVLATSAARAAAVVKSLKCGESIRKRWKFVASTQKLQPEEQKTETLLSQEHDICTDSTKIRVVKDVPLFTLKTPIQKGSSRNLNLFEPRWLKMMDQLANSASSSEGRKLGCVQCSNKFYSAISIDGSEGRYADIIFDTIGNLAELVSVEEGVRPVSGDRRLSVALCGGDSFIVEESNLVVCQDGYMIASAVEPYCLEEVTFKLGEKQRMYQDEVVRIVVVAGLLHGNGILSLLSGKD